MGSIGGLFGTAGGASGTGFKAPGAATNLTPTTDKTQLNQAYTGVSNTLSGQDALLSALQNQNGLTDQSNVFNAQAALQQQQKGVGSVAAQGNALTGQQSLNSALAANNAAGNQANAFSQAQTLANQQAGAGGVQGQTSALQQQQALNAQLAGANGVGNLSGALTSQQGLAAQQQALAQQYQDIAAGKGPNPAQAALNQSTGQNVANQAALMAGQRGAGSNIGLLARQAAQQGAATQQQAVGQGATLQAQQALAGLSGAAAQQQAIGATNSNVANIAAQQIAAQQAGTTAQQQAASNLVAQQQAQQQALAQQAQAQVAAQQSGLAAQQQAASGITSQQQAQQQALAQQANTLAGQQVSQTNANTQAQLQQQQAQQQAAQAMNSNQVNMQSNINSANAGLAGETIKGQKDITGGLLSGAGQALFGATGGKVHKFADGGIQAPMAPAAPVVPSAPVAGPQSSFGKFISGFNDYNNNQDDQDKLKTGMSDFASGAINKMKSASQSPSSSSMQTAGPDMSSIAAMTAAKGGMAKKHDYTSGGHVKATKPKEKAIKGGNSYDNDKIPAYLSENEIVLPRSVTQSKDPVRASADFVAKVLAKRKRA
jgi:hypothetical protein